MTRLSRSRLVSTTTSVASPATKFGPRPIVRADSPGKDCRHTLQLIQANRFDFVQRRSAIEDRVSERHTATRGGRLFTVVEDDDHVSSMKELVSDGRPDVADSADQHAQRHEPAQRESCASEAVPGGRWSRSSRSARGPNIMRPDAKSSNPTSTMPPPHMARRMTRGSMLGSSGIHGSFAPQDGHTVASRATSVAHGRQGTVSASTLVMRQPRRWTCGWSILRHALMNATIAFSSTVFVSIRVQAVSAALCPLAHDDYSRTHYGFGSGIFSRSMRRNFSGITACNCWALWTFSHDSAYRPRS